MHLLQIADDFDMPFFEVSCKNDINIEEAFLTLARKIREYRENKVGIWNFVIEFNDLKTKQSDNRKILGTYSFYK